MPQRTINTNFAPLPQPQPMAQISPFGAQTMTPVAGPVTPKSPFDDDYFDEYGNPKNGFNPY